MPIIGWSISVGSMLATFTMPSLPSSVSFPVLGKFYHWLLLLFLKVKHNPIVWSLVPYHFITCKLNPSLGDWWWCTKLWVSPENSSLPAELAAAQETGQAMDINEHKAFWHWAIGDRSCRHHVLHAFPNQELAPSLPSLLWNQENTAPFSPLSTHTKQSNCGLKRKEQIQVVSFIADWVQ